MKRILIATAVLILFNLFCSEPPTSYTDNLDPDSVLIIDTSRSFITNGDTTNFDSINLILTCPNPDLQIQSRLEKSDTTVTLSGPASPDHGLIKTGKFGLDTGKNIVRMEYFYDAGNTPYQMKTFTFFRALPPGFSTCTHSPVEVVVGTACTLKVSAIGTGNKTFVWSKNGVQFDAKVQDSLLTISSANHSDTGMYTCRATTAWGSVVSDTIRVDLRYKVTYDGNGQSAGKPPIDEQCYIRGSTAMIARNTDTLVKTGFSFAGWNRSADGSGKTFATGSPLTICDSNCTLFAKWDKNSYTVTYDGNGFNKGSPPLPTRQFFNDPVSVPAQGGMMKTGYSFYGWNTTGLGNGIDFPAGASFTQGDSDMVLYARWLRNRYTVNYAGNGNSGGKAPADTNCYVTGTVVKTLGRNDLVKKAHTFRGWNSLADGSGIGRPVDSTFIVGDSDVTWYAQWKMDQLSLSFDMHGGTVIPPKKVDFGIVLTEPPMPKKTGTSFAGWYKDPEFKKPFVFDADTIFTDITLHAKWNVISYKVIYSGNGNSAGTPPFEVAYGYGDSVNVSSPGDLARSGYSFAGWNSKVDGSGKSYAVDSKISIDTFDISLNAQWTKNPTFSITYDGNGRTDGIVPKDEKAYETGAAVTIAANTGNLMKTGYTFSGWNSKNDGSGMSHPVDTTLTMGTTNLLLYALWSVNKYTVVYDGNGSTGGNVPAEKATYIQGTSIKILSQGTLVKKGHYFAGWTTKNDGSGNSYSVNNELTIGNSNITLFAQWKKESYVLQFFGNGNSGGLLPISVLNEYGTEVVLPDAGSMYKTGNSFAGWNAKADGTGNDYPAGGKFTIPDLTTTLFAKWSVNQYTITYDGNGYTQGHVPDKAVYKYEDSVMIAHRNSLVRTGYRFDCWNTRDDGTGINYKDSSKCKMNAADLKLYAKWKNPEGMVKITAAGKNFLMGDIENSDEQPIHKVTFNSNFWISITEVTQGKYKELMSTTYPAEYKGFSWNDTIGKGPNFPAYSVTWFDAVLFCNALTKATNSTDFAYKYDEINMTNTSKNCEDLTNLSINFQSSGFRLPTESEWEYACRGVSTTDYYWNKNYPVPSGEIPDINNYAVWARNSFEIGYGPGKVGYGTHIVGQKNVNPSDLYDMIGNLAEWCNDWYGNYNLPFNDPTGSESGQNKVARGGSWISQTVSLRSADRFPYTPATCDTTIGFRCVLP